MCRIHARTQPDDEYNDKRWAYFVPIGHRQKTGVVGETSRYDLFPPDSTHPDFAVITADQQEILPGPIKHKRCMRPVVQDSAQRVMREIWGLMATGTLHVLRECDFNISTGNK